ncbi:hypothetical protein ACFL0V_01565 [Nanoarchaeota archaeon]
MAFFGLGNPLALFFAFIVLLIATKVFLGRMKFFSTRAAYIFPVVIVVGIIALIYMPILKIFSVALPLVFLGVFFLVGLAGLYLLFGVKKPEVIPMMKDVGFLRLVFIVAVVCAFAFGVSQVFGDKLLEDQKFSIADAITPDEPEVEVDFAPLFTRQALGLIMVLIVMGALFVFVSL